MHKKSHTLILTALAFLVAWAMPAAGQSDRRDRSEPELIVETGARLGACDALTFTNDGERLLATGDDKVVRSWRITDHGFDSENMRTLRWSSWREQRGAIYALALSPDKANERVAIAGYGMRTGTVAVLDRATGHMLNVLSDTRGNDSVIWSLAFAPDGKQLAFGTGDGSVWLWNLTSGAANDSKRIGKHGGGKPVNRVRLVAFLDNKRLLSVAENGQAIQWDTGQAQGSEKELLRFTSAPLFRAAFNGTLLAVAGEKSQVVVRSLDDKESKDIDLPAGSFPHSLAFDNKGERLAVGIRAVEQGADFFKETDDLIRVYDLKQQPPRQVFEAKVSYHAEALAFHPDDKRLASAGGNDHEVVLWDLTKGAASARRGISEIRGPGAGLWGVALSKNGRYLSLCDQRDNHPVHPNKRASGPWRVFDLEKRKWAPANANAGPEPHDYDRLEPLQSAGGWKLEFSQKDQRDAYTWFVVGPNQQRWTLPLDRDRDAMPRCYSFVPAAADKPVRLVVGHYWGLSIFDLTERGPRRTRLCIGHQGEVMSLGLSADLKWLVSASRDQTIAAWSLAVWPSQPELGAKFGMETGKLLVNSVDVGSPAWEAGLIKGDEIVYFAFDRNDFLYDPQGKVAQAKRAELGIKKVGTSAECLDRLKNPVPGKEFYLHIKRGQREIDLLTTVRQRPLWRFFPTRDRDWVLWMWRSYYYDTSTNGDFLIGWQINNRDLDKEPAFYRAEQFRKYFHRPEVIDKLLGTLDVDAALRVASNNPVPPSFDALEPPAVRIELAARDVKDGELRGTLSAAPRGDNPDHQPQQVELWINDYRFQVWQAQGQAFQKDIVIPASRLRPGRNDFTLQTYNRLGGRAEAVATVNCSRQQEKPRLYGLSVGINDYSQSQAAPDGKRFLGNLRTANRDAQSMKETWAGQKGKLYQDADVMIHLDREAGRETILKALKELAGRVKPDDRLLLFLAGHGDFLAGRRDAQEKPGSAFVFCCPDYDRSRFAETGITSQSLYEALAMIPCRKIVILDACHSGEAVANPVRSLTPGGKGPIILAACDRSEFSFENEKFGHGLFTYAILEALGTGFEKADRNHDGRLDAAELFAYAQDRLPELLKEIKRDPDEQNPISFPSKPESYPLAQK